MRRISSLWLMGLALVMALALAERTHAQTIDLIETPDVPVAELTAALLAPSSGISIVGGSEVFVGQVGDGDDPDSAQSGTYVGLDLVSAQGGPTLSNVDGILLTSGTANVPITNTSSSFTRIPGTGGDADLSAILTAASAPNSTVNDVNFLSFDFMVPAGVDGVRATFIYASDEFPDQGVTDVFAVIVDGVNYAAFQDGSLVSFVQGVNAANFHDNDFNNPPNYPFEYDGISNSLTVAGQLNPDLQTHTIKIAIADTGDSSWDSVVFIGGLTTCEIGTTCTTGVIPTVFQIHPPFPVTTGGWPEAIQISQDQSIVGIALQANGVDVADITDRDAPNPLGNHQPTDTECPDGFSADELLFDGEDGVVIVSAGVCGAVAVSVLDDPNNPIFLDRAHTPFGIAEETVVWDYGDTSPGAIGDDDSGLFVASYWQGLQSFSANCGEPVTPGCNVQVLDSIGVNEGWGVTLALWLEGDDDVVSDDVQIQAGGQVLIYLATSEGLRIVDATDPADLQLIGSLDTNPDDLPLVSQDDVPQDIVVADGYAYMPLWIGGLIVIDVQDPTNPTEIQRIAAQPGSAIFKAEISDQDNRVYVSEGLYGLSSYLRFSTGILVLEERYPIGAGDDRCIFTAGVADVCWTWAIDEVGELVGATYGVLGTPPDVPNDGGFQLITQPPLNVKAAEISFLPEPHALLLQGSGLLAIAALSRLRRRRE